MGQAAVHENYTLRKALSLTQAPLPLTGGLQQPLVAYSHHPLTPACQHPLGLP